MPSSLYTFTDHKSEHTEHIFIPLASAMQTEYAVKHIGSNSSNNKKEKNVDKI